MKTSIELVYTDYCYSDYFTGYPSDNEFLLQYPIAYGETISDIKKGLISELNNVAYECYSILQNWINEDRLFKKIEALINKTITKKVIKSLDIQKIDDDLMDYPYLYLVFRIEGYYSAYTHYPIFGGSFDAPEYKKYMSLADLKTEYRQNLHEWSIYNGVYKNDDYFPSMAVFDEYNTSDYPDFLLEPKTDNDFRVKIVEC